MYQRHVLLFFLFSFEKMEEYGLEKDKLHKKSKIQQAIICVASPL